MRVWVGVAVGGVVGVAVLGDAAVHAVMAGTSNRVAMNRRCARIIWR